ncbi:hypothetical protein AAM22_gp88 [Pantoea phage vB_PagM_AAM22]|nr:hypothetical protein AAM22_gp88 [Pantoea phage vB_PagM_AAM22]
MIWVTGLSVVSGCLYKKQVFWLYCCFGQ